MSFNKGDLVIVKSGSPLMVVTTPNEKDSVCQYWNPFNGQLTSSTIPNHLLKTATQLDTVGLLESQVKIVAAFKSGNK